MNEYTPLASRSGGNPIVRIETPKAGDSLPYRCDCKKMHDYVKYYRGCFLGGLEFAEVKDPRTHESILVAGEHESSKTYTLRKTLATVYNYCDPIVRRFQCMANFGIVRDKEIYPSYIDEVDRGIQDALITGRALFLVETESKNYISEKGFYSLKDLADLKREKALYTIKWIDPLYICNWTDDYSEFILKVNDELAKFVTPEKVYDLNLSKEDEKILSVTDADESPDQWIFCTPTGNGESFLKNIAPLQVLLYNFSSYLVEELSHTCFSTTFIIGASGLEVVTYNKPAKTDSKDNITIENVAGRKSVLLPPGCSVEVKGSDPAQAKSMRDAMLHVVAEIYANAGLKSPESSAPGLVESGLALYMKHQEVIVMAKTIAEWLGKFENQALEYISKNKGGSPLDETQYKTDYDEADSLQTIQLLLTILEANLPPSIKKIAVREISEKLGNVDSDEKDKIDSEIEKFYNITEEQSDAGQQGQGTGKPGGHPDSSKVARQGKKAIDSGGK